MNGGRRMSASSRQTGHRVGFVIVGATLDTSQRRTFPALFRLHASQVMHDEMRVVAVCVRASEPQDENGKSERVSALKQSIKTKLGPGDQDDFLSRFRFVFGDYRVASTAAAIKDQLRGYRKIVVYFTPTLFLGPSDSMEIASALRAQCEQVDEEGGFLRCIIEKPQGLDLYSARALSQGLVSSFGSEKNVFRLDHFLGKSMIQNIVALRFANRFLEPSWNNQHIRAVVISCREVKLAKGDYLTYFDRVGIVREIMMDHLLHILALVAMEAPVSLCDIGAEVTKVLRCIQTVKMSDIVLGQYEGYGKAVSPGEEPITQSRTPTFATCVLYINNPRWHGVPFILKAGKGLYERRTDIRIQFKNPHNQLFPDINPDLAPNELVIRVQPNRDIYMKMMRQMPGASKALNVKVTKLDFLGIDPYVLLDSTAPPGMPGTRDAVPEESFQMQDASAGKGTHISVNSYVPDSYERLIRDVLNDDHTYFSKSDEVEALFSVFTPLLEQIELEPTGEKPTLIKYKVGSRGPLEAYTLMESVGFHEYKLHSELLGGGVTMTELQRFNRDFSLSLYQMEEIVSGFLKEFQAGLDGEPDACIRMLPSYVTKVPDGSESGVYYALDLGGTNFRTTRFELDGKGGVYKSDERKFTVPPDMMIGSSTALFDFLAECVSSVCVPEERNYGFTFSFPIEQNALACGTLIKWNKGFNIPETIGQDVVQLLNEALERRGFEGNIVALANDTVGTLVSSAYTDPRTMVGLIIGTGTNAAYREKVERIPKLPKEIIERGGEMIINTEWGNFGSTKPGQLPFSSVDVKLDAMSVNPGMQRFEKMISGMYLGDLAREIFIKLHSAGELWASAKTKVSEELKKPGTFPTRHLSDVEYDLSENLEIVQIVENHIGVEMSTLEDRLKFKEVCGMVVSRAAKLTACSITAALRQIGPDRANGCTVGIDGSVYEFHPSFRMRLKQALGELGCQCKVVLAKDGSGQGSALIACGALKDEEKEATMQT